MVGVQVTKDDISFQAGLIAKALNENYIKAAQMKQFFDRIGAQGLLDLGFTQDEVDIVFAAITDLEFQKNSAFDSSIPVKQLYGLGF